MNIYITAELELQKLQRQYRLMEGDRKAYGEESKALITKQRFVIKPHFNKKRVE